MSVFQSESDDSSSDSTQLLEEPNKESVPLSGSMLLLQLPGKQQHNLNLQIKQVEQLRLNEKITIRFQPIGSSPAINPRIVRISADQPVRALMTFVMKKLRLPNIHLYIQNTFQPTPDETIGDLYLQFKTQKELIVGYCNTVAFG